MELSSSGGQTPLNLAGGWKMLSNVIGTSPKVLI